MADEKKKGVFSRLFGPKKSCCCNMKIEEVAEDPAPQVPKPQPRSSCCGREQGKQDQR